MMDTTSVPLCVVPFNGYGITSIVVIGIVLYLLFKRKCNKQKHHQELSTLKDHEERIGHAAVKNTTVLEEVKNMMVTHAAH
jgi:hypothetical protein